MGESLIEHTFYFFVLLLAGGAEYLKIAPPGTFLPMLAMIVGHYLGNLPVKNALNQNTNALVQNTTVTATVAEKLPNVNGVTPTL